MKRALFLLIFAAVAGFAQPRPGMDRGGGRVLEMISAYRITRMTQELGLSDEQIATILPRLRERDSLEIACRKEQSVDYQSLETELGKRTPNERRIGEIMTRMQEREQAYQAELERVREEIMQTLTVEQQARFIVFEIQFEKELKELINRVRGEPGNQELENENQPRRTE
ncbi:periplasmic heavy metal sensor [candidate division WOR-3 bacterium]|nr:periplasmic heavy metal sensor [candidate division WOR-3 bacterium]